MTPRATRAEQIAQVQALTADLKGYEGCDGAGLYRCPACNHCDIIDCFDCMGASPDKVFCNQCHHHHAPKLAPRFLQRIALPERKLWDETVRELKADAQVGAEP